jgi:hypothetical protein
MKIYEYLTLLTFDFEEAIEYSKKYKQKINIFYSFKSILWQGPKLVKVIERKLKRKNHNFIAEANLNIGLALSLIELDFKYLAISKKMDDNLILKVNSIAKKKKIKILISENFTITTN